MTKQKAYECKERYCKNQVKKKNTYCEVCYWHKVINAFKPKESNYTKIKNKIIGLFLSFAKFYERK